MSARIDMKSSQGSSVKRPKLDDIAKAMGVSRATVSNVFNRPEIVNADLKERILEHARQIGYYGPDPKARAMRRQEIHEVAVVFHHALQYALTDPQSMAFLRGVVSELDRRKLALQLIPRLGRKGAWDAAFSTTADAVIIHDQVPQNLMPQLLALRKPLVLVDAPFPGFARVNIADFEGAASAARYALEKQPDRVVICALPMGLEELSELNTDPLTATAYSLAGLRLKGYLSALLEAGFDTKHIDILTVTDVDPESAIELVRPKLGKFKRARLKTAVLCMTDRMALPMVGMVDAGVVALVGFDDIAQSEAMGLTTVRQDSFAKGVQAVCIALDTQISVTLPTELVVRET